MFFIFKKKYDKNMLELRQSRIDIDESLLQPSPWINARQHPHGYTEVENGYYCSLPEFRAVEFVP